jgi:large subunit ribosomal protein L31
LQLRQQVRNPFYTGKQKTLDTGGRVQRFADRFGQFGKKAPAPAAAE